MPIGGSSASPASGLRRPTPAAIEQRHRGGNARALTLAVLRDLDESFESGVGVRTRKLADLAVTYRPSPRIPALSFSPWHCSTPVLNVPSMSASPQGSATQTMSPLLVSSAIAVVIVRV
jgi:hypothetical protein